MIRIFKTVDGKVLKIPAAEEEQAEKILSYFCCSSDFCFLFLWQI